jgi:hypothetical protein
MRRSAAALALLMLIFSVTVVHARGGRTTSEDCEPGSPDPDCPDQPPPPPKKKQSLLNPGPVVTFATSGAGRHELWFLAAADRRAAP